MAAVFDAAQFEQFNDQRFFFRVQKWGWRIVGFWPGNDHVSKFQIALAVANSIEILRQFGRLARCIDASCDTNHHSHESVNHLET